MIMGNKRWYVIHTYSGYENKVRDDLERKVKSLGMEEEIFRIEVPKTVETRITEDGKKKEVESKIFPGYVLIEMIVNDRNWYAVRNTTGVTGFVGSGNTPIPLSDREVEQIMGAIGSKDEEIKTSYQLQQVVRLKSGPFAGQTGEIAEIDTVRAKLKVLVDMFGRKTPVDVDYSQVEEVE